MNTVTLELIEYVKMREELNGLKDFINNPDEFIVWADSPYNRYHVKRTQSSELLWKQIGEQLQIIQELRKELANQPNPEVKTKSNFFKKLFKI